MNRRLRVPAWQAPMPPRAEPLEADPTGRVRRQLERVYAERMHDLPFLNPALGIEVLGFRRWCGDWVGIAITPWSFNLLLLPGGGTLWSDRPTGERVAVEFPAGRLDFIADHDPLADPPASQYCPLLTSVAGFSDPETARAAALDALDAVFSPPPPPPAESSAPAATDTTQPNGRRGFFRRLAGQR